MGSWERTGDDQGGEEGIQGGEESIHSPRLRPPFPLGSLLAAE